jgi:hypothetical protein
MRNQVLANIRARFRSYDELARQVSEDLMQKNLDVAKNKTVAEHLWCVVGARESYGRALSAGAWSGFECSVKDQGRESFIAALGSSAEAFDRIVGEIVDWSAAREKLLVDLLEHETMHEGQLIRHMYALGQRLPRSWKWA